MEIAGLKRRLKRLPRRLRVVFSAFCVQRVLPAFERNYNEPLERQPHHAVELAWRYASGADVSGEAIHQALDDLGHVHRVINQSSQALDPARYVCMAAACLLDVISETTEDESANQAFRCTGFAIEAVLFFEDYAGPGAQEELKVQDDALQITETWGENPIVPQMFDSVGSRPPNWLTNSD